MTNARQHKVQVIEEAQTEIASLKESFQTKVTDLKIPMPWFIGCEINSIPHGKKTYGFGASSNKLTAKSLGTDLQVRSKKEFTERI